VSRQVQCWFECIAQGCLQQNLCALGVSTAPGLGPGASAATLPHMPDIENMGGGGGNCVEACQVERRRLQRVGCMAPPCCCC
jgi:hypothetical protein